MLRRLTILFHIAGLETEYQMSGFFPVDHKHNAFGVPSSAYSRRRLKHQASIYAPLLSSGMSAVASAGNMHSSNLYFKASKGLRRRQS